MLQNQNTRYLVFAIFLILLVFVPFAVISSNSSTPDAKKCPKVTCPEKSCPSSDKTCPTVKPCPSAPSCPKCHECADDASIDKLAPPGGDGQVTMETTFGKALYALASQSDVKMFLEIGTWFGGGSSTCIASGLKNSGAEKKLYTIELFEPAWLYARKRLRSLPVVCLLGGTVPASQYLSQEEIPSSEKGEHYRLYYHRDIKLAKTNVPLLEPVCKNFRFDAVLIDGNEYSGWAEFIVVRDVCKPKYLALHDVGTLKTIKISDYLAKNTDKWQFIKEGMDGAKWQIWKNLEY